MFLPSTIPLTKGVVSVVKIGVFEMEFFEDDDAADAEEAPESLLVSMPSIIDIWSSVVKKSRASLHLLILHHLHAQVA